MLCRRSKYMDFFICASFCLLFVYAYFSRQVLLDRLRRKEIERERLEHNANSLKEELKIVYYHTAKLEEALKAEQDSHKITNNKLATQAQDYKSNITNLQILYKGRLKQKSEDIKLYTVENVDLKHKHQVMEEQYTQLAEEHKKVALKTETEFAALKRLKEEESLRFQDEIQETYNQKIYFQKKALTSEDDYKKTLKKLVRCKSALSRRNTSINMQVSKRRLVTSSTSAEKKNVNVKEKRSITDSLPTEVPNNVNVNEKITPAKVSKDLGDMNVAKALTQLLDKVNQPITKHQVFPIENVIHHNTTRVLPFTNKTKEFTINEVVVQSNVIPSELPTEDAQRNDGFDGRVEANSLGKVLPLKPMKSKLKAVEVEEIPKEM